ncbi:MAG: UvrD-helicase domain-containing protein [Spirochaetota bacterium]|jgi:exodeoxyribonuclease V beta subunit|nr:UvrD-helicase domain-containing protein [Spirochaetota bacterium]
MSTPEHISPADIDITRHGIIEASAGTGKTWLLERLFVRILGQKTDEGAYISLGEIVVVTFTDKAAAEMRDRIREYLQSILNDDSPGDKLNEIRLPADETLLDHLETSLHSFEEARISTIHSFCRRMLSENAYLCGVPLEYAMADDKEIYTLALERYLRSWRGHSAGRARCMQSGAYQEGAVWRKRILALALKRDYRISKEAASALSTDGEAAFARASQDKDRARFLDAALDTTARNARAAYTRAMDLLRPRIAECLEYFDAEDYAYNKNQKKRLQELYAECARQISMQAEFPGEIDCIDRLYEIICSEDDVQSGKDPLGKLQPEQNKPKKGDGNKRRWEVVFPDIDKFVQELRDAVSKRGYARALAFDAAVYAIRSIAGGIKKEKRVLSFDDLIQSFAGSLAHNPALLAKLQKSFRYALIDEFQDSDRAQWDIFKAIFLAEAAQGRIFLIGDPKQAIYGFRGGDVATYFRAQDDIQKIYKEQEKCVYTLSKNYRSTPELIHACNQLFEGAWFSSDQGAGRKIAFKPSQAPSPANTEKPAFPDGDTAPVVIVRHASKTKGALLSAHARYIAREIARLVAQSPAKEDVRRIQYGDCAVLVRSRDDAESVMRAFRKSKIPFLQYKHGGLWATPEAEALIVLVNALASLDANNTSRALVSPFFDCPFLKLHEALYERAKLREWSALADARKWALLAARIEEQYFIRARAVSYKNAEEIDQRDWERKTANMRQLIAISLLSKDARILSPQDMVIFVQQKAEQARAAREDEDIQPLSSEADRVRIMTMHMAKGLQFPIVFIHGGFGTFNKSAGYMEYYTDDGEKQYVIGNAAAGKKMAEEFWKAELARLMYVAVTRAMLRVYLPLNTHEKPTVGMYPCLRESLGEIKDPALFQTIPVGDIAHSDTLLPEAPPMPEVKPLVADYEGAVRVHTSLSFSKLEKKHKKRPGAADISDESDEKDDEPSVSGAAVLPETRGLICLPRGKASGLAVHTLFENMDFARAARDNAWLLEFIEDEIRNSDLSPHPAWCKQRKISESPESEWSPGGAKDQMRAYLENLIHGVLAAPMPEIADDPPFRFSMLSPADCLKEVDFAEQNPIAHCDPLEDMMTGVIDLIFWHNKKIYIADWKTNWLPNYGYAAMEDAMEANEYHLQAAIYAHAVSRFLRQRGLPSSCLGGVVYVFVRAFTSNGYYESESEVSAEPGAGLYFMDRKALAEYVRKMRGIR